MDQNNRFLVLITAKNPNKDLIDYIRELNINGLDTITVNDGSDKEYKTIFEKIEEEGNIVLDHARSMGKGRSIKTAVNYMLNIGNLPPYKAIITTDSSGMYTVDSIIRLSKELEKNENATILVRQNVNYNNVDYKNRILGKIASFITRFVYGKKIVDNMTGLRAYPIELLGEMLTNKGEYSEYETSLLVYIFNSDRYVRELRLDNNYHYEVKNQKEYFLDSIRVIKQLFSSFANFSTTSFISAIVDLSIFKTLLTVLIFFGLEKGFMLIFSIILLSKSVASFINLLLNKNYKFKNSGRLKKTFYKNSIMSLVKTTISSYLIYQIVKIYGYNDSSVKIIVDIALFLITYKIYYSWVYSIKNKKVKE